MLKGEEWLNSPIRRKRDLLMAYTLSPVALSIGSSALALSRLVDGPDPLFKQERIGKGGRPFTMYKIRTMPQSTEASPSYGALDSRATKLGRPLRVSGIDETPQMVNILLGDMAIFGHRALPLFEIEDMENTLAKPLFNEWFNNVYLATEPGFISSYNIQEHGRPREHEESYKQRAIQDIYDYEHASPLYDMQLFLGGAGTVSRILTGVNY